MNKFDKEFDISRTNIWLFSISIQKNHWNDITLKLLSALQFTKEISLKSLLFQATYQAQQAESQFQNSAHLFAQQQRARAQQEQHRQQEQQRQQARQPVYYIQPSGDSTGELASSQIEAFLRGHNIQF